MIQNAINSLTAQIAAVSPEGSQLLLDMFDRDGVVGPTSYVLDLENYDGGKNITIGRRPVFNPALGDQDKSVAWLITATSRARVEMVGDLSITPAAFITGLPKTVYVGVGSNGTPQFFEDTSTPFVLYLWSMLWSGTQMTQFKRMSPFLNGYTLTQAMAGRAYKDQVFDAVTNWLDSPLRSATDVVILGDKESNGLVDMSAEVVGFFVSPSDSSADGWFAPAGNPPASEVRLEVESEGAIWSKEEIVIDCGQVPDTVVVGVNAAIGDDRFIDEVQRFVLKKVSVGSAVVSATGFTWGPILRNLYGLAKPKDTTILDQV